MLHLLIKVRSKWEAFRKNFAVRETSMSAGRILTQLFAKDALKNTCAVRETWRLAQGTVGIAVEDFRKYGKGEQISSRNLRTCTQKSREQERIAKNVGKLVYNLCHQQYASVSSMKL